MSTTTATEASSVARPRAARWGLVVLQVLLAALYLMSGVGKVSLDPTNVAGFAMMGIGPAGVVALGVVELAAAIGLVIPRLAGLTATCCVALMVGAVTVTAATVGGAMILLPAVVLVLVAVVAWVRRGETATLVRDPRGVLFHR